MRIRSNTYHPSRLPLNKLLFFTILTLALASSVFPQQGADELFTPHNRLKFANYLFCQQDYLRAVDEYEAYLLYETNDTVLFKVGYAYRMMGRFSDAVVTQKRLLSAGNLQNMKRIEIFGNYFIAGDYQSFRNMYSNEDLDEYVYQNRLNKLYYISYLIDDSSLPPEDEFLSTFNPEEKPEMLKFYMRKLNPGYKSPTTAALLSAAIPGMGKIYTEDYGDGITAFLVNGLLAYLTYDNFNNNRQLRGWIFAGLTAFFYAGNVYGSAASAQIYNAQIRFSFDSDLKLFLQNKNYYIPGYDFLCN